MVGKWREAPNFTVPYFGKLRLITTYTKHSGRGSSCLVIHKTYFDGLFLSHPCTFAADAAVSEPPANAVQLENCHFWVEKLVVLGAVDSGSHCIPNGIPPSTNDTSMAVVGIAVFNQKVLLTPRQDSCPPLISASKFQRTAWPTNSHLRWFHMAVYGPSDSSWTWKSWNLLGASYIEGWSVTVMKHPGPEPQGCQKIPRLLKLSLSRPSLHYIKHAVFSPNWGLLLEMSCSMNIFLLGLFI